MPDIKIRFESAECTSDCHEPGCPYIHRDLWVVYEEEEAVRSFGTEERAKQFADNLAILQFGGSK